MGTEQAPRATVVVGHPSIFGFNIRVADSPDEWARTVLRAQLLRAIQHGNGGETTVVIDERAGLIMVRDDKTLAAILAHTAVAR